MRKLLAKSIFSFVSSVFTGSSAGSSLSYITSRLISPFSRSEGHPVSSSVVLVAASIRCSPIEQPVETCETVGGPATG